MNYIVQDDGWNPEQASQVAAKLVNGDKVVAMVGSTNFVECAANAKLYADQNVVVIAGVGVPRECFESANIVPTNEGPRLSTIGAVQYMVKTYNAKSFLCMVPNIPNMGNWSCDGIGAWGKDKGITVNQVIFDPATLDATSLVLQLPKRIFYSRLPKPEALTGYTISSHIGLGRVRMTLSSHCAVTSNMLNRKPGPNWPAYWWICWRRT